jgi:hypothetical protein
MDDEDVVGREPPSSGPLNGTEALDLYFRELASKIQLMSQQSALLLQALSERADLLAHMGEQAEAPKEPCTARSRT